MVHNIIYSPWGVTKGPWICLIVKQLLFWLAWLFLYVCISWIKFAPWTLGKAYKTKVFFKQEAGRGDFHDDPMVKNPPCKTGDIGSIHGRELRPPHATKPEPICLPPRKIQHEEQRARMLQLKDAMHLKKYFQNVFSLLKIKEKQYDNTCIIILTYQLGQFLKE